MMGFIAPAYRRTYEKIDFFSSLYSQYYGFASAVIFGFRYASSYPSYSAGQRSTNFAVMLHNGPFLIRGPILQFWGIAHTNYLMQRSNERAAHVDFEPVGRVASTSARKLGEVTIGLPPAD
jgi:hypothetical protein